MANEVLANEVLAPPPDVALSEADYRAFCNALEASARGRAFLAEFARRNRHANTGTLLAAIDRLQTLVRSQAATSEAERIRQELRALLAALAAAQPAIDESAGAIKAARLAAMIGFVQHRIESIVSNGQSPLPAEVAALTVPDEMTENVRGHLVVVPRADEPELPIPTPEAMLTPAFALVPQPAAPEPEVVAETMPQVAEAPPAVVETPAPVAETPAPVAEGTAEIVASSEMIAEALVVEAPQSIVDAPAAKPTPPLEPAPQGAAAMPQIVAETAAAKRVAWIMPEVNLFEAPKPAAIAPAREEESPTQLAISPPPYGDGSGVAVAVAQGDTVAAVSIATTPLPSPPPQSGREQVESAALVEAEWTEFALADFRPAAPDSPLIRTKDQEQADIASPLPPPPLPAHSPPRSQSDLALAKDVAGLQSGDIGVETLGPGSPLAQGRTGDDTRVEIAVAQSTTIELQPTEDLLALIMALSEAERIALFT